MIKFVKATVLGAAVALVAAFSGQAQATLIGDDVTLEVLVNGSIFGPFTETVGAGVEFNLGEITADVGASTIVLDQVFGGTFLADIDLIFSDLDFGESGVIVDVVLTAFQGIGSVSVSFTGDSVTFSLLAGDQFDSGPLASIEIITRQASVPEPGSLALLGLGLAGLGFARRKVTARAA